MNIKINKKLVSLLLAGTLGFSLCACNNNEEISIDTFSFDEIITDIEDESLVDDALEEDTITLTNSFNGSKKTMNMMDASKYLEDLLSVSLKLHEMGIEKLSEDDDLYYLIEEEACTWTIDDTRDFISDFYYDDTLKNVSLKRLEMMAVVYDSELRTNGIDIATKLLEDCIDNTEEDTTDYIEILDSIKNIRDHREEFDYMNFYDMYSLVDNVFDKSKEVMYISGNKNVKIKTTP